jgi:hypothetical protein
MDGMNNGSGGGGYGGYGKGGGSRPYVESTRKYAVSVAPKEIARAKVTAKGGKGKTPRKYTARKSTAQLPKVSLKPSKV